MSGSSLDGMDIGVIEIQRLSTSYEYSIKHAVTIPYDTFWAKALKNMSEYSAKELVKFDFDYAAYCAKTINEYCTKNKLTYDVVSFHGHTIFHSPGENYTFALGNLSSLSALTESQVIGDFREMDVALGGQGAPLMAIADTLLFHNNKININLGGICNISVTGEKPVAYDICPCNQLYNIIYDDMVVDYDDKGVIAKKGSVNHVLLDLLNEHVYYSLAFPKSLDNNIIAAEIIPHLNLDIPHKDKLRTIAEFVSSHITKSIHDLLHKGLINDGDKLMCTGGGTHNDFLLELLKEKLIPYNIIYTESSDELIDFKELVLMALLAFLKKTDKVNVLKHFTGATKDTISGGVYG